MSLVAHIQASMNMLETAIVRELPAGDPQAHENVVVLDDVAPCYVKANVALRACKAGLAAALHCMLDTEMPGLPDANATGQIWRIAPKRG